MTRAFVAPASARDKPAVSPLHQEAVDEAWEAFRRARDRAMRSAKVEDGIAAGHAWGAFLRLFEKEPRESIWTTPSIARSPSAPAAPR
jgi:hypothetical protein